MFLFLLHLELKNSELKNAHSVGTDIILSVKKYNDLPMAVRYFNKSVLNFEANNPQENIDTHLSKYCYCQNDHFSKTFIHPDIQEKKS